MSEPREMSEMMAAMMSNVMPTMMTQMMPTWLKMMLPRVSGETRKEFVSRMVEVLVSQGGAGLSPEDLEAFKASLVDLVKRTSPAAPSEGAKPKGWG